MRRNYNYSGGGMYGGMMMNQGRAGDRQMAFVNQQRQRKVMGRRSDRFGGQGQAYMDSYYESYDDAYAAPGPMRMRPRGMGGSSMMESYSGNMRGMGSWDEMGPRQYDKGREKNDPKYLKQCKQYLANIKKNIPTNKDHLSVYCAACSFLAKNNQDFFSHRGTPAHIRQMDKVQVMPESIRKSVKKIIDDIHQERSQQKLRMFCDVCDERLHIPYSDHKNFVSHQLRSKAVRSGCIPCKTGPMKNYPTYKEHCDSELHKKTSEEFQQDLDQKIETCTELKEFPIFQEGVLYGTNYVKEASGFYCPMCRRFLQDEDEKNNHIKHQWHFNHVRDLFFNKNKKEPIDMGDYTLPSETKMETKEETKDTTNGNQEEENKEEKKQEEENKEEENKEEENKEAMETTET